VVAAAACFGLYVLTGIPVLGGIAHAGAWINLFNLIPVWQLDGGRGFNALDRRQRGITAALVTAGWLLSGDAMFLLVLLGAGYRLFLTPSPTEPGKRAMFTYGALIVGITLLSQIRVPELEGAPANSSVHSSGPSDARRFAEARGEPPSDRDLVARAQVGFFGQGGNGLFDRFAFAGRQANHETHEQVPDLSLACNPFAFQA
jgi:hypothetical protein